MHTLNLPYPPVLSSFQPPIFTQVPIQPSSTCLWLKPHPPINKLAIITALPRQPLIQTGKKASLGPTKWENCFLSPFMPRRLGQKNPPSANQGVSKMSPGTDMLFASFSAPTHLPLSLPLCSWQNLERTLLEVTSSSWMFHAIYRLETVKYLMIPFSVVNSIISHKI